jgi:hypothetical protein
MPDNGLTKNVFLYDYGKCNTCENWSSNIKKIFSDLNLEQYFTDLKAVSLSTARDKIRDLQCTVINGIPICNHAGGFVHINCLTWFKKTWTVTFMSVQIWHFTYTYSPKGTCYSIAFFGYSIEFSRWRIMCWEGR